MCRAVAACDFGALPDGLTACFRLPELATLQPLLGSGDARFNLLLCLLFLAGGLLVCLQWENTERRTEEFRPKTGTAVLCALLASWSLISLSGVSEFLYAVF
ncbi:hypothetical protein SDC9_171584 [bioreactor metagenome]|uniref:Uncharacterized protein n=1 Tax=bioreactor metagenome TaxID=1076179 RepID=A0A645GDN5_9ZZZZ